MMLIKMTLWGLVQHPRRTALILFSVAISVFFMEIFAGMGQGIRTNFFQNILAEGGHGQIRGAGWQDQYDPRSLGSALTQTTDLVDLLRSQPELAYAEPLLEYGSVFITPENYTIVLNTIGVQADTRVFPKVTSGMVSGSFLPTANDHGGSGNAGPGNTSDQAVISRALGDFLNLEVGDLIRLITEDFRGAPRSRTFTIGGMFSTDSREFDTSTVFVPLEAARTMVRIPNGATQIRFTLTDRGLAPGFTEHLAAQVQQHDGSIHHWRDLNEGMLMLVDMTDVFIWVFNLIMMIVAATVITNAILMNVFDRMGEFGTLRAIGMRKAKVFGMVLLEGSFLGVLGSLLGVAIGIPVILYFQEHGLDFGEVSESLGMGSMFNFGFSPARSLADFVAGSLTALLGSLYAGILVFRTSIVDALKD